MIENYTLFNEFERTLPTLYAERTCLAYLKDLSFFKSYWKGTSVLTLTTEDLERYLIDLSKRRDEEGDRLYSDRTLNRHRAAIVSFYRHCLEQGYIEENPATEIKLREVSEEKVEFLTRSEIDHLLRVICPDSKAEQFVPLRDYFMVRLSLNTGLTTYEILHLTFDQLDFDRQQLTIVDVNGKRRMVELPKELQADYERYLTQRLLIEGEGEAQSLVFLTQNGTPIKTQTASNSLLKYAKRMRTYKRINQSMLRHTYAYYQIERGTTVQSLSALLGHCHIYFTERLYHSWLQKNKTL